MIEIVRVNDLPELMTMLMKGAEVFDAHGERFIGFVDSGKILLHMDRFGTLTYQPADMVRGFPMVCQIEVGQVQPAGWERPR